MLDAQSIEDLVINALKKGTKTTSELIQNIALIRANSTKQGIYRVLRKLKGEEKIVIHGKLVSLNIQWLKTMGEFYSLAEFYYSGSSGDTFLNLKGRDKIVYSFKNLNLLDAFGIHPLHIIRIVT